MARRHQERTNGLGIGIDKKESARYPQKIKKKAGFRVALKKLFILGGVLFFLFEPVFTHTKLIFPSKNHICPVCGMKDTCGDVCCCVKHLKCQMGDVKGLMLSGACHSENPYMADSFSHIVKWVSGYPSSPSRVEWVSNLFLPSAVLASVDLTPASPPPRTV